MLGVTADGRPRGSARPQESVPGEMALRDVGLRCRVRRPADPDRRQPLPRLERRRAPVRAPAGRRLDLADRNERPVPLDLVPAGRRRAEARARCRRRRGDPRLRAAHRLPARHGRVGRVRDGARRAPSPPTARGHAASLPSRARPHRHRPGARRAGGSGVGDRLDVLGRPLVVSGIHSRRDEHLPDGVHECRRTRARSTGSTGSSASSCSRSHRARTGPRSSAPPSQPFPAPRPTRARSSPPASRTGSTRASSRSSGCSWGSG